MTQTISDKEAERLATRQYIKTGYFGGKTTSVSRGIVKSIKYFPFAEVKNQIKNAQKTKS